MSKELTYASCKDRLKKTEEVMKKHTVTFFAAYFIFGWLHSWDRLMYIYTAASIALFAVTMVSGFMLASYLMMGLLVLQKELGTPLVLFLVYFVTVYIFESNIRMILANAVAAVTGLTQKVIKLLGQPPLY